MSCVAGGCSLEYSFTCFRMTCWGSVKKLFVGCTSGKSWRPNIIRVVPISSKHVSEFLEMYFFFVLLCKWKLCDRSIPHLLCSKLNEDIGVEFDLIPWHCYLNGPVVLYLINENGNRLINTIHWWYDNWQGKGEVLGENTCPGAD